MPKSSSDMRHFIIVAVLVAIGTVVMDWLLKVALPLPVQASIQAATVDQLIGWNMTLIAFLFSLVVVFMLYAMVVFRKRDNDESEGEHFHGNSALEIIWTILPLIVVVVFSFIGVTTLAEITKADENQVVVKVTGFQWAWTFEYPEGIVSPELVLPVGRQARMEMTSKDVLHSFWVPEFRVKQDLVPGQVKELVFNPSEVGVYKLRCAELCGLSHWNMLAVVRVLEQSEYDAWLNERTADSMSDSPEVALASD